MSILYPTILINDFDEESATEIINRLNHIVRTFGSDQVILVEIDSDGGDSMALIRLIEAFAVLKNPICTFTRSKALSCGAIFLSVVGSKGLRFASPLAEILIHEVSAFFPSGNSKAIIGGADHVKKHNDKVMTILAKSMGLKNRKDIKKLIESRVEGDDLYISAKEALKLGMVDAIRYVDIVRKVETNFNLHIMKIKGIK